MNLGSPSSPGGDSAPASPTRLLHRLRVGASRLLRDPRYRLLRWVLLVGVGVRLLLAPLTSWGLDTPTFIIGGLGLIYTGSPYTSSLFFNPPLGPFTEAPFLALVTLFIPPQALVPVVNAITPAAAATGMASVLVPLPVALLALKLPLILGDLASTLVLFWLMKDQVGSISAQRMAAIWFLNPVLIWSSAVHGEVDGLAALFILLFLLATLRRWPVAAGAFLGLAIFTKAFPVVLLPVGFAAFFVAIGAESASGRARVRRLASFGAGCAAAVLPFIPFIPALIALLSQTSTTSLIGGMSPLIIFNGGVPKLPGVWGEWETRAVANWVLDGFRVLAIVTVIGATMVMLLLPHRRSSRLGYPQLLPVLGFASLWAVVGIILADAVPESENMVGPLALLLVAAPTLGRFGRIAYLSLSAAAFGLYMALLTPLAYFYPLAVLWGNPAIDVINQVAIAYSSTRGLFSQTGAWLVCGIVGGGTLLAIWAVASRRLLEIRFPGLRPREAPAWSVGEP